MFDDETSDDEVETPNSETPELEFLLDERLVPVLVPLNEGELLAEVTRLAQLVLEKTKVLCGAYPDLRGAMEVSVHVASTVTGKRARVSNAGWQCENRIHVNIGRGTEWSSIVETICHEVCHYLRPDGDRHSPAFWSLLDGCLFRCYGVSSLGLFARERRCFRSGASKDAFYEGELYSLYAWAKRVPSREHSVFVIEGYSSWARKYLQP